MMLTNPRSKQYYVNVYHKRVSVPYEIETCILLPKIALTNDELRLSDRGNILLDYAHHIYKWWMFKRCWNFYKTLNIDYNTPAGCLHTAPNNVPGEIFYERQNAFKWCTCLCPYEWVVCKHPWGLSRVLAWEVVQWLTAGFAPGGVCMEFLAQGRLSGDLELGV